MGITEAVYEDCEALDIPRRIDEVPRSHEGARDFSFSDYFTRTSLYVRTAPACEILAK